MEVKSKNLKKIKICFNFMECSNKSNNIYCDTRRSFGNYAVANKINTV